MMSSDCAQIHVFDELLESDQIGFASLRPLAQARQADCNLAVPTAPIWQFSCANSFKELETHKS